MPRKAVDYSNCCIYKIEHIDDDSLVYVGNTTNFHNRKNEHKNRSKNENGFNFNCKLYQMMRENGGWDAFKMIEVEKYPCNDKREAEKRENEIMKDLKANMNTKRSYVTKEEEKKDSHEYYIKNKEMIIERSNKHYENNKEQLLNKMKERYINNKEQIIEQHKEYTKKNRDKIRASFREKVKCDCGREVVKYSLKRHQKTILHNDLMKAL